uniref:Autophagy-related protein 16 domain-containing protein n=1 Tax=Panagrolaimus sp. JU765 TaxID=591449 RepID=A0AC34R2K0_9BILA
MGSDFRSIILENLQKRNKKCAQFERVFQSYNALSERLNFVAAQNNKLRQRTRGASESTAVDNSAVDKLQKELDSLYRLKAANDQQLIDTNNKLAIAEKKLQQISLERDELMAKVLDLESQLEDAGIQVKQLTENRTLINDELLALHANCESLQKKYIEADQERNQLIERLKDYKMQEIEMINRSNEAENERVMKKITEQLSDASMQLPPLDSNTFEMLSPDGLSEVVFTDNLVDLVPSWCRQKISAEASEIHDLIWHPNGKVLFSAGNDKRITMWDVSPDYISKRSVFTGASQTVARLDIDQDSKYILGACSDQAIRLWSIDDQRQRTVFTGHADKVASARFYMNSRQVVSGSNDRTIKTWDISNGRCVRTFFSGSIALDVATNERVGAPMMSSHCDRKVRFWDSRDNTPCRIFESSQKVTSLSVTPDGYGLLMMSRDETLSLLDLRNYSVIHIYSAEQFRTSTDTARCCISPNGTYVCAGSADSHVFIWDMNTTKLEKVLYKDGHDGSPVLSVAWHPHGRIIASGDRKKTICLWS